jgi:hypothetical protein
VVSFQRPFQLQRIDGNDLAYANPARHRGQVEQGGDASIGEERQPVDQLLVGIYRVSSRRETLSTALNEKGRLKVTVLCVVRVVIGLRVKGRQEKQRYKDQSRRREREIRCFRYDIGKNMIAHDRLPQFAQ